METELKLMADECVVFLIDMQYGFLNEEKRSLIPGQISILKECKNFDIPVIIFEYSGEGNTIADLNDEIQKIPNHQKMIKTTDDAFESTPIREILRKIGRKKVIVMGVNACACVLKTVKSTVREGYEVITNNVLIGGYCCSECRSKAESWYRHHVDMRAKKLSFQNYSQVSQ